LKRILATVSAHTHVTKVPAALIRLGLAAAAWLFLLATPSSAIGQAAPTDARQPGPAGNLYLQLRSTELDSTRVFRVRDASLDRSAIHITLEDGTIAFTKDVMGRITGALFEGDGELLLAPPDDVERRSMSLFTGMAILEERFSSAYFRFNEDVVTEFQSGLRAPDQPEQFIARYNETARNLAQQDAMRLLATFSELLPVPPKISGDTSSHSTPDPNDHFLHVRLQGNKLGVFDLFFDSTAAEDILAGQSKSENGTAFYDVWTSFSAAKARRTVARQEEIPEALPVEAESREDPIVIRSYVIDARVNPPKQLDAEVQLRLKVVRGGSRFLMFSLSRFLQIHSVETDGKALEFIHNPAVEGTRLARSGDDLVAVIFSEPVRRGQEITLRFKYGGEVLADAGKGLLYVGARGTWYPNRGLDMADFDLTFHYPRGWTLLATGKPTPVAAPAEAAQSRNATDEQAARFVSERPIPVAGFNLGKYVRATAQAGDVSVATYATRVVERDFPKPPALAIQIDPKILPPQALPPSMVDEPSPARNEEAVSASAARAIDYYSARFGPYPFTQLALTQMPGPESQGWPGLVFLSSYAFLTREEQTNLQMSPANAVLTQLIPAHEAAHQWWGDLVMWSTYRDQWFSEGLANYCALMMLQEKNPTGFKLVMEKYRQDLADKNKAGDFLKDAGPVTLGTRLLSSHLPEGYQAIGYGRATWLFHMLHSMLVDAAASGSLGPSPNPADDPFVRSLHKVRERYAGKAITTRELLDVFAEDLPPTLRYEGKSSLDWFIDGWINGTALPRFELQNVKFVPKQNSTIVSGVIKEKDAPEELVTSVPLYAVSSGKAPTLIGRVFADGPTSSFRLSAPAGTHKLLLDPNETILTGLK
jgi:hypothetical protein